MKEYNLELIYRQFSFDEAVSQTISFYRNIKQHISHIESLEKTVSMYEQKLIDLQNINNRVIELFEFKLKSFKYKERLLINDDVEFNRQLQDFLDKQKLSDSDLELFKKYIKTNYKTLTIDDNKLNEEILQVESLLENNKITLRNRTFLINKAQCILDFYSNYKF